MSLGSVSILALALAGTAGLTAAEVPASPDAVSPLLIGAAVPDVTVRDATGNELSLAETAGGKPTILIFYRGGW